MPTNKELEKRANETDARIEDLSNQTAVTGERVEAIEDQMGEQNDKLDAILDALNKPRPTRAIDNPVTSEKSGDQYVGELADESGSMEFDEDVDVSDAPEMIIEGVKGEVGSPEFEDKMEYERFMNDKCLVEIHEVNGQFDDPNFTIAVNNHQEHFFRGQRKVVPRYIVEGLARAKPIHYGNEEYRKDDGVRAVRYPKKRGLRYPFHVMKDPAGARGTKWLQDILRQP